MPTREVHTYLNSMKSVKYDDWVTHITDIK